MPKLGQRNHWRRTMGRAGLVAQRNPRGAKRCCRGRGGDEWAVLLFAALLRHGQMWTTCNCPSNDATGSLAVHGWSFLNVRSDAISMRRWRTRSTVCIKLKMHGSAHVAIVSLSHAQLRLRFLHRNPQGKDRIYSPRGRIVLATNPRSSPTTSDAVIRCAVRGGLNPRLRMPPVLARNISLLELDRQTNDIAACDFWQNIQHGARSPAWVPSGCSIRLRPDYVYDLVLYRHHLRQSAIACRRQMSIQFFKTG